MSSDLAVTATSSRDVAAVDTGTRRWPRRAFAASWLLALPLFFLGYGLAGRLRRWALGADSSVYRAGAALLLHGHSPYVVSGLGYLHHLSFTYPPAAALLFSPLAALPAQPRGRRTPHGSPAPSSRLPRCCWCSAAAGAGRMWQLCA